MSLLIVIAVLWGIGKLISAAHASARERRRQAEQARSRAEAARLREEWRRQQAEAKAEQARLIAVEREQMRLRKEQEKQAREQARQAEQLAKHEERIAQLEFRMSQAEADIEAESERIAQLWALMDLAAAEQDKAVPGSKTDVRCQKQIISLENQIHAAEKRKARAEFTKQTAQQKLSA